MAKASARITSSHVVERTSVGNQTIEVSGDQQMKNGTAVAFDFHETVPGAGPIEIVSTGGKIYAKLPASLNKTGKPWIVVSATSKNAVARAMAASFDNSRYSSSPAGYARLAKAASTVKNNGATSVNGTAVTHYSLVVKPSKLPQDFPNRAQVIATGLRAIPVHLYVDHQGRPLRVTEHLSVSGQTADVSATFSAYNKAVHITAPPASRVSTG